MNQFADFVMRLGALLVIAALLWGGCSVLALMGRRR
jgi:hypothetical protein